MARKLMIFIVVFILGIACIAILGAAINERTVPYRPVTQNSPLGF